jgi:hypothetical protein
MAAKRKLGDAVLEFEPDPEWPELTRRAGAGTAGGSPEGFAPDVRTTPGIGNAHPTLRAPPPAEDAASDPVVAAGAMEVPRDPRVTPDGVEPPDLARSRDALPSDVGEPRDELPTLHDHDPLRHDLPALDEEWESGQDEAK